MKIYARKNRLAMLLKNLVLCCALHMVNAANILFVPGHGAASHTKGMYPLAAALARNGHQVTMLQLVKLEQHKAKAPANSNVQDYFITIPVSPEESAVPLRLPRDIIWKDPMIGGISIIFPWKITADMCKEVLDNEELRENFYGFIRRTKWDLIFVDDIFAPCGMLAAEEANRLTNASMIIDFGTSTLIPHSVEIRGLPLKKGLHPSTLKPPGGYYDHRSFNHRLHNVIDYGIFYFVGLAIDYLVPRWVGLAPSPYTSPSRFSLHSDLQMASLSPMIEFTKAMARDVIELDVDCPKQSELPEKYKKFVEDPASKGTILLAMGHAANWDDVPDGVFESFLEAFEKLSDYRIVWQYVTQKEKPKVPSNILLDGWVPQTALLYHPKTKAFISHVGGKSLRETICAGVPAVAMPMFAEQYRNAAMAHKKRISVFLDKTTLSPESIYATLKAILDNSAYEKNIRRLQQQLEDQITKPTELGRFWAEFLTKHGKPAMKKYMRMKAADMPYFDRDSWDVSAGIAIMGIIAYGLMM